MFRGNLLSVPAFRSAHSKCPAALLVIAPQPLGYKGGFVTAFYFHGHKPSYFILGHILRREVRANANARGDGRDEAQLIESVIDAHLEVAANFDGAAREVGQQRNGKETVSDGRAERRFAASALDIDVDPLVVAGEVGEAIDHFLGDLYPVADSDFLAGEGAQFVQAINNSRI